MCLIVFLAPNESHLERRIQLISSITRALFNCTSNVLFIAHDFDSRSWQCVLVALLSLRENSVLVQKLRQDKPPKPQQNDLPPPPEG